MRSAVRLRQGVQELQADQSKARESVTTNHKSWTALAHWLLFFGHLSVTTHAMAKWSRRFENGDIELRCLAVCL